MGKKIKKTKMGYEYFDESGKWNVQTDYHCGNIYLDSPNEDAEFDVMENYGIAIQKAVQDMKKDIG